MSPELRREVALACARGALRAERVGQALYLRPRDPVPGEEAAALVQPRTKAGFPGTRSGPAATARYSEP